MIKVADKQSMDPIQQKLRAAKKQWNKDVSAFIDDLIHYKKLTNGQPNKFFKERSSIKDPIPADPATILGTLANDFQELSQRGSAIVAAQADYSKTRRKKQLKAPVSGPSSTPVAETPASPDLGKQLAAFEMKYGLVAEGSSPVSRFFTKLLNPGIGFGEAARIRKYRMSLLTLCAKMYKDMEKFQVEIVKSSNDSITKSYGMLNDKIWHNWDLIYKGLATYKNNMPAEVPDAGGPIESPAEQDKGKEPASLAEPATSAPTPVDQEQSINDILAKVKAIQSDYTKSYKSVGAEGMSGADTALEAALFKFMKAPGQLKPVAAQRVIEEYSKLIQALNQSLGTSGSSISEIASQKSSKAATASDQLEKVAQDFLWKWLGKKRHQMSSNINSGYRLDLYKMADEVRESLDKMMDSLESGMNLEELTDLASQVHRQIISMKGLMRALYSSMPKPKGKGKAPAPAFDFLDRYM
jgi:hypothetical protein